MEKLLVGYDGSGPAREAVRTAAVVAQRLRGTVTVLTVGQLIMATGTGVFPAVDEASFQPIAEEGAAVAQALGVPTDARARLGDPADVLAQVAADEGYDLIVVGHRGVGGFKGLLLGSVAKKVATDAECPVLVVRGTAPTAIRAMLVAVDGSAYAQRAAQAAVVLAKAFDARVTLLSVFDPTALAAVAHPDLRLELRRKLVQAGLEALAEAGERCKRVGAACDVRQGEGPPTDIICSLAQEGRYDLVAVGRRGISGIQRLALGSVSDAVLQAVGPLVLVAGEQAKDVPA